MSEKPDIETASQQPTCPASPIPQVRRKWSWRWLVVWILLIWIGAFFFGPVVIVLLIAFLAYLLSGLPRPALLLVACSPALPMFLFGVVTYWTGNAVIMSMGLPETEFHNLSRLSRAPKQTGGCLVHGGEFVLLLPNNLGIQAMGVIFGPMPGSYDGPYPTREEAFVVLATGQNIRRRDIMANRIPLPTGEVRLDADVGPGLLRGFIDVSAWSDEVRTKPEPLTVALVGGRCLVLRILDETRSAADGSQRGFVALIDVKTGRPFAFYEIGEYYHRFPPVWWKRPEPSATGPAERR